MKCCFTNDQILQANSPDALQALGYDNGESEDQ